MIKESFQPSRSLRQENVNTDLVVVGGGMAGVCTAITAARAGIEVVLIQDRPVLGGNSSSEVRLWVLGATSHMGNNNRWAREGGVMDEILLENTNRNKEGNAIIWDTILLEKVYNEDNITLLLNTSVHDIEKKSEDTIEKVIAFCPQNSTTYHVTAPLFSDCSGDGIVAFMAGASFRMGAESPEEFGEKCAPNVEDYGELLGHSIFFHTKDTGKPVKFKAPSYALKDAGEMPKIKNYQLQDQGCRMWWVEYGGRLDTVHQTEDIKWELWKVIYGIWNHVKNSGEYPDSENLTLEWVGTVPGKRESRRFIGDYFMIQQDIVERRRHEDAVAFGGWAIDLHPADGVYSDKKSCTQYHSKGIYQIPYRCYYSKEISNLFLGGRIISVSHVAFGSTRVMATCGHGGQAVGMAAALAIKHDLKPRDLSKEPYLKELQKELNKVGQAIPNVPLNDPKNLVNEAELLTSSTHELTGLPYDGPWRMLKYSAAQMIPMKGQTKYKLRLKVRATETTTLRTQLRATSCDHYTPDRIIQDFSFDLKEGETEIQMDCQEVLAKDQYGFVTLLQNEKVEVKCSEKQLPGVLSVHNKINPAVSNFGKQEPEGDIGIDAFEFWCPNRRPEGHNMAFEVSPSIKHFGGSNLNMGIMRPTPDATINAWSAAPDDEHPRVTLKWPQTHSIRQVRLFFDGDHDHAMESVLMGHPEEVMPLCVQNYRILDSKGEVIYKAEGNYQSINTIDFDTPVKTDELRIEMENPRNQSATLYEVLCYE